MRSRPISSARTTLCGGLRAHDAHPRCRVRAKDLRRRLVAYDHRHGWRPGELSTETRAINVYARWRAAELAGTAVGCAIARQRTRDDASSPKLSPKLKNGMGGSPRVMTDVLNRAHASMSRRASRPTTEKRRHRAHGLCSRSQRSVEPSWPWIRIPGACWRSSAASACAESVRSRGAGRAAAGSAFKPLIYTTALDNGYTPASIIVDGRLCIEGAGMPKWCPKNYEAGSAAGPRPCASASRSRAT